MTVSDHKIHFASGTAIARFPQDGFLLARDLNDQGSYIPVPLMPLSTNLQSPLYSYKTSTYSFCANVPSNYAACESNSVIVLASCATYIHAGSEVVNGGTTELQDVPILGLYQTPNDGKHCHTNTLPFLWNTKCGSYVHTVIARVRWEDSCLWRLQLSGQCTHAERYIQYTHRYI